MKLWSIYTAAVLLSLTGAACVGGWVEESSPSSEDLYAVFGVSSGDIFAVGTGGTVLRRQNARWRALDSGTSEDLYGVWGTADDHVVVVGENCAALEYDGPVEPPEEGEPPPDLHALNVSTCGNFRDLDGDIDSGGAFVVGERTASQWYGGGGLSSGRDFSERMQGVSMEVNDEIHACGDEGAYYRKHDGSWALTSVTVCGVELVDGECPEGHEASPVLWDVWAGAQGKGAVVGSSGGVWRLPPPAEGKWATESTGFDADLMAVHGYTDTASAKATMYAAGKNGVMIRITPEKVSRESPGTHADLYGVWVSQDGSEVYAVGQAGTIVHLSR